MTFGLRGPRFTMNVINEIERLQSRCRDEQTQNWVSLPVEGSELCSCLIHSCGKRGTAYLLTVGHPPLHVPLSNHVVFGALDGVVQRLLSLDDVNVGILIQPFEDTRVRLTEAKVDFWLEDEDSTDYLAPPKPGQVWELNAAFNMKLRFEAIGSASSLPLSPVNSAASLYSR